MMYGQSIQACFLLYMWWIVSLQSKIYNCHVIQYARQTAVRLFKQLIPSYGSIISSIYNNSHQRELSLIKSSAINGSLNNLFSKAIRRLMCSVQILTPVFANNAAL